LQKQSDVVGLAITGDSEQLGVSLSQLDEDLSQTYYVDGLPNVFMNQ
jgi:hypothetical protein